MQKSNQAIENQQKQILNQKKHEKIVRKICHLQIATKNLLHYIENNTYPEEAHKKFDPAQVSLAEFLDSAPKELNEIRDNLIQIQNKLFNREIENG